ncbi:MAG: GHKL domain-containing protein [Opitutales bacterium]|nr:GHKL domain-containing protein [Opitutales bacterium]MCH8541247.1 GHKL domain-containing protein [Opitutales bacterium]
MTVFLLILVALWAVFSTFAWIKGKRLAKQLLEALKDRQAYLPIRLKPEGGNRIWFDLIDRLNDIIRENRRLERERSTQIGRLQATLESIQEAVLIVDDSNEAVLTNPAFDRLFASTTPSESLPTGIFRQSGFLSFMEEVRRNKNPGQKEIEFTRPSGLPLWFEITGSAIPGFKRKDKPLHLFVLHDITRLKQLESVRKEFVANVSHELRTPLSIVKGYTETLVDDPGIPSEQRKAFLETIHKHTDRLIFLLEDLLALSRLEGRNPKMQWEEMDLRELIQQIANDYQTSGIARGRSIDTHIPNEAARVKIDVAKIRQVLENLLDNAIKYTPENKPIEMSVAKKPGGWILTLQDHGQGIAAKHLPHLFERFYRVDKGRSRDKGGTGLGLSIVKHIILLHGGTVEARSRIGEGTTMVITLPEDPPRAIKRKQKPQSEKIPFFQIGTR